MIMRPLRRGRLMTWQPKRLTRAPMEERRLAAGRLLRTQKRSLPEVARQIGVSRTSVLRWKRRLADDGQRGRYQRRSAGRPPRLSAAQWQQLLDLLQQGAVNAGFATER